MLIAVFNMEYKSSRFMFCALKQFFSHIAKVTLIELEMNAFAGQISNVIAR